MERKNIPIILMLVAGAITCVFTFIQGYSILKKLVSLFVVLLIFYFIGTLIKWAFDTFENQNAKASAETEEEIVEEEEEE